MKSNILNNFSREVNKLASSSEPFLMIMDFAMERPLLYRLDDLPGDISFLTPNISRYEDPGQLTWDKKLKCTPVAYNLYSSAFNRVIENIIHGNTYLLNLTFPSEISIDLTPDQIFGIAKAKYKLLYKDEFVVFSPETFVEISDNTIRSYPMKGTIDASVPDALEKIMSDEKELSEHNTIVDLIRNDLSMVADKVSVPRYRYHESIRTGDRELIQISSEISGNLGEGWQSRLGDILLSLLPAGSISGAPKAETIRIINECETDNRGYYTGIFGVFDGSSFDSAVMIRFIEQINGRYVYRSGGGITYLSDPRMEYDELIAKVYVPAG